MLGEWWSLYRNPALNSFHLLDSRWLRLVFFFPHCPVFPCIIFYRRVCCWFNSQITCIWRLYWPSRVFLKTRLAYLFFSSRENHVSLLSGRLYGYTLQWHAPIRKSLWLVCIFILCPQPKPYFHMTAKEFLTLISKGIAGQMQQMQLIVQTTSQHVLFLLSD